MTKKRNREGREVFFGFSSFSKLLTKKEVYRTWNQSRLDL